MVTIKAEFKAARKVLKNISEKDVPAARVAALNRAGRSGITGSRRAVSASTNITQKHIKHRFSLAKAKGKKGLRSESVAMFFRYHPMNPAYMDPVAVGGSNFKKGGRRAGYIKAGKQKYERAWIWDRRGSVILQRDEGVGREPYGPVFVEIGKPAVNVARREFRRIVPPEFKKRFKHELDFRVKRRREKAGSK